MSQYPSTSRGPPVIEFQNTKRGHRMLCRAGYDYVWKRTNKDGTQVWRCTKKDSKCNAIVKTSPSPLAILNESKHNHAPKTAESLEIDRQMHLCMKNVMTNINKPVTKIYEETMEVLIDQGIHIISPLPEFQKIKTKLYRNRNKSIGAEKLHFNNAINLEVPKKYKNFIFADYSYENKRILILAKTKMTTYLSKAKRFFLDGTFKISPTAFHQVYTIHADIGSNNEYVNVVPVLYALLPDKTQVTYNVMFQLIKSQVPEWEPTHIHMDFEVTAILAVKDIFPNIKIVGCYFHFSRCLWRKAKEYGVTKSNLGRIHVKLCTVLSHLPPNLLDDGWLYVMEESPNTTAVTKFNDYFVQTWLQHPVLSSTWNTFNENHRTNNIVESWNAKIKRRIPVKPNIAQLMEGLQNDANYYYHKIAKTGNIEISKRSEETKAKDTRINNIINDLLADQIHIGHCLEKLR